jgi:hypothetical protein
MITLISIGVALLVLTPFAPNVAIILGGVWLVAVLIAHVAIALRSSK